MNWGGESEDSVYGWNGEDRVGGEFVGGDVICMCGGRGCGDLVCMISDVEISVLICISEGQRMCVRSSTTSRMSTGGYHVFHCDGSADALDQNEFSVLISTKSAVKDATGSAWR